MLFLTCILFFLCSSAQEKYSKVKIPVTSPAIKNFVSSSLDLDHYEHDDNNIIAVLNNEEMMRLRQSGFSFQLLIDDVGQYTTDVNRNTTPV